MIIDTTGDVRVNEQRYNVNHNLVKSHLFKKVPRPMAAGILCIRIAKKMTKPTFDPPSSVAATELKKREQPIAAPSATEWQQRPKVVTNGVFSAAL